MEEPNETERGEYEQGTEGKAKLQLKLEISRDPVVIDKMPIVQPPEPLGLTLWVTWPYRSIWEGECPTSKTYDFYIRYQGKEIWRWSDGKVFLDVVTPVRIPGGSPIEFARELWKIDPDKIQEEGTYTAGAIFIASGQEVTQNFQIQILH